MEKVWKNNFKKISITTRLHKEETIETIEKMPNILIIKYNRYKNNDQLNHYIQCNISMKFNTISYKLKAVIINNDHHKNNIIIIEDHEEKNTTSI